MSMIKQIPNAVRTVLVRPTTREDRNVRRLLVHTALFGVVNGGVITFLPVLLARLGAPTVVISLLTALPALVTIVFALPAGAIVARWRDMVRNSALCFYLLRLAYIPIALAMLLDATIAPYLIVVIWALTAIPGTLGNTTFYDVVADAVPPEHRAVINGVRWALLGALSAASVSLFGQLLMWLLWPANYFTLFGICFVAGVASTWFYGRIEIPLREPVVAPAERVPWSTRLKEMFQPLWAKTGFGTLSLVTLVLRIGLFLPAGLFSVLLVRELGVSDAWIGGRTTLEQTALTLGYFFWGRMANRLGEWRLLAIAASAIGVGFLLISAATPKTLWLVQLAALVTGFFISAVDVSLFEWLLAVMPPGERPRYVAMNTLLMNLVMFGGPILGATLAERTSISLVYLVASAFLFACALLTVLVARPRLQGLSEPQLLSAEPLSELELS